MQESEGLPRPLATRSAIDPFIVMDVMAAANARKAKGHDVIHMEVGQPGTPAPRAARERASEALRIERLGYTEALGMPELRARIARYTAERYGVPVAPERVVVTSGSSAGFVLAFLALFDAGDAIGLPSPGYPCYRQIANALGLAPRLIETSGQGRWMPTAADVEKLAAEGAAGLLLASPNNPTGTMTLAPRLREIAQACRKHLLWLISDEIYHGLEYEAPAETALAHSDAAIVVNSFSKYFSMTGWRIGWMVVPEALVRPIERLAQNLYISPPAISQVAALGAFDGIEELEAIKAGYARNRAMLLEELPCAGFTTILPADGAFYLYADVSRFAPDSEALAKAMLREIGVAVTPGIDFDPVHGRNYLRFSYAGPEPAMREAARRITAWMR
ncbi:pyridoxal phosphate-dependent aminotransferase [Methyloceanibacter sp.]|uniref:pyridoxal phosphate-dependent aminotransferase n=1 Tax=Methyloceanibacter sp. TaxID=1965321 RepID=UPI002C284BF0|nr:aminotransferase class I/II-fold pyridoxal phosphate-dependent enzyme [Methyloceanibacter sp.]